MPTHPVGAEVRQDPIRFKNLIKEAEARLIDAGVQQNEAMELLQKAQKLDNPNFWEEMGQGLAMFLSKDIFRYYSLPLDFQELVVVTDRFHVKPLLQLLNGDGRFYLLTLSQKDVKFFEGTRYSINKVELQNLPQSLDEALQYDETASEGQFRSATSTSSQPGQFHGHGSNERDNRQENILQFFHIINATLHEKLREEKVPLVLAGVDYLLPLYREANTYQHLIEEGITGNQKIDSLQELHNQAWQIVEPYFQKSQEEVLQRYHELFGANTYYQRVDSLLVGVGTQQWGLFDPSSETIYLHEEEETGDEDLLDFVAAHTLLNGGTVYAVAPEEIPYSTTVAAIFRY
jgi:Bacterial archaeo-eukaryotic release factor family 7